jgi:hypothetical protein
MPKCVITREFVFVAQHAVDEGLELSTPALQSWCATSTPTTSSDDSSPVAVASHLAHAD